MRSIGAPMIAWIAGLLVVIALAPACATYRGPTNGVAPSSPALLPSAEAEEATLLERVPLDEDPALTAYLAKVGERLLEDTERATIVVLRDPTINAFALPTGRIYVHTGLLARLENEAQLATILGRELTHLRARHVRELARRADDADIASFVTVRIVPAVEHAMTAASAAQSPGDDGGAVLSPTARAIFGKMLSLAYVASISGHGGELERDADAGALARLVRAGYDPKEAPKAFERLRREARGGGVLERFFLGDDAALGERIETMTGLVSGPYAVAAALADTLKTTDDFDVRMAEVARENARLETRAGRFRLAQEQLDRALLVAPRDPIAYLYLGDLHRLRSQRARSVADRDELARRALASYERALALDPTLGEVVRQLGLLYYQQRQEERAREAFERYIALDPAAPDVPAVREYLAALRKGG